MKIDDVFKLRRGACVRSKKTGDIGIIDTVGKKKNYYFITFLTHLNGDHSICFNEQSRKYILNQIDDLELINKND